MATSMAPALRAEDVPLGRRVAAFGLLMWFEFFYGWSWNTVDVLRPQIRESIGLTLPQVGLAYTAQSIGALVGAIILGQVADHRGRRTTLFWIVVGYSALAAAGSLVTSFVGLMAQRFALGFFLGGIFPVLIATYMGLFPSTMRGKLAALGQGTYNISVMALGWALAWAVGRDWHILLWAGSIPALLAAPLIFLIIPDDRQVRAWGADAEPPRIAKLPIVELFSPALRGITGRLFLLVGLNFFAYQAFAGWVTTFLKETHGLGDGIVGPLVAWQFGGAVIGGFFWGWFADRYGRRLAGVGFVAGALAVLAYLLVADGPAEWRWAGAVWGFMITASVAWAPWMSELFPAHLRSTAMSIFNWGRIISMTAPIVTGLIAETFGLQYAMLLSAIGFGLGAVVWLSLPETIKRQENRT
jgi:MFS family permease